MVNTRRNRNLIATAGTGTSHEPEGLETSVTGETDPRQQPILNEEYGNVNPRIVTPENAVPVTDEEEPDREALLAAKVTANVMRELREMLPRIVTEIKEDMGKKLTC